MTDNIKELVKQLRDPRFQYSGPQPTVLNEVADAIEAQAAEVKKYKKEWMAEISASIDLATLAAERRVKLKAAEAEVERLRAALDWALGEGDEWPERKPGEGAFYWRAELRRRALEEK